MTPKRVVTGGTPGRSPDTIRRRRRRRRRENYNHYLDGPSHRQQQPRSPPNLNPFSETKEISLKVIIMPYIYRETYDYSKL